MNSLYYDESHTFRMSFDEEGESKVYEVLYDIYDVNELERLKEDSYKEIRFIVNDLMDMNTEKDKIDYIFVFNSIDRRINRSQFETIISNISIKHHTANSIFCIQSVPLIKDFHTKPTEEETINELRRQALQLEYLGFRNINIHSKFENSIAYLYLNLGAIQIMRKIHSLEIV